MKNIWKKIHTKSGKAILIAVLLLAGAIADLSVNTLDNSVIGKFLELAESIEVVESE